MGRRPPRGFLHHRARRAYLPIDPDPGRPTVAAQERDPGSTLNLVRRLVALRKATPALGARAGTRVLHEGYPFAYVRGDTHLVVVNPRRDPATLDLGDLADTSPLLSHGVAIQDGTLEAHGFGYGIFALSGR